MDGCVFYPQNSYTFSLPVSRNTSVCCAHSLRLYTDILTWAVGSVLCLFVPHPHARRDLLLVERWSIVQCVHDEMLPELAFQGSASTALRRGDSGPAQSLLPPVHLLSLWYPPFPSSAQHNWSGEMHWCNVAIHPTVLQNVTS